MIIKLISCEVFTREVCLSAAHSTHIIDIEFTQKGAHNDPDYFRKLLQKKIDRAADSERNFDAIALCLGICGNSTVGLKAPRIPIIIPRAHDCCTLFLGSKEKFKKFFGEHPSSSFNSAGYLEHGGDFVREAETVIKKTGLDKNFDELVEEYGEENAKFIFDTLHSKQDAADLENKLFYIEIPEFAHLGYAEFCEKKALNQNKTFVKIDGSIKLIENLIRGNWNDDEFLIVPPGKQIAGVYDLDEVVKTT